MTKQFYERCKDLKEKTARMKAKAIIAIVPQQQDFNEVA
jgi:hypothetical protein